MIEIPCWGVLRIVIGLCFATLSVGSSSGLQGTTWTGLPEELGALLHRSISELPPFPEDPSSLRDVRRWPKRRTFDGESYDLVLEAWDYDAGRLVGSPDEIPPGSRYAAKYIRWVAGKRVTRGPFYFWGPGGTVYEQAYLGAHGSVVFGYDPKGQLMQFRSTQLSRKKSWLSCSKRPRLGVDEWFDQKGNLIGFRAVGFEKEEMYFWAGSPRTYDEYIRLMQDWHPWRAAVRDSMRGSVG